MDLLDYQGVKRASKDDKVISEKLSDFAASVFTMLANLRGLPQTLSFKGIKRRHF